MTPCCVLSVSSSHADVVDVNRSLAGGEIVEVYLPLECNGGDVHALQAARKYYYLLYCSTACL